MLADRKLLDRVSKLRGAMLRGWAPLAGEMLGDSRCWYEKGSVFACYTGPNSPLTQAYGIGLDDQPASKALNEIAEFYAGRVESWELVMTPFSRPDVYNELAARGATLVGFESCAFLDLPAKVNVKLPPGVEIQTVGNHNVGTWNDVATRGFFGDSPSPEANFLGELMLKATGIRRYLALVDGCPAASASLQSIDGTAFLGGAATLPEYRGRGLQSALIARRLADAGDDSNLAIIEFAPGSTSGRNAERHGFRVGYTQMSYKVS